MLKIKYNDNYIKVDVNKKFQGSLNGDIFAGSWDMLEDCFGTTADTIEDWCKFNGYCYSVKKYTPHDELLDSLYLLHNKLNDGTDYDMLFIANEISILIENYNKGIKVESF